MKNRSLALAAIAILLAGSAAYGDGEKILRLRNGRKIQGEILEETATSYLVKTHGGGKTTIAKDAVVAIDDAPPAEKPVPPDEGTATVGSPTDPRPTPAPLVPDGDVAAAKKLLLAVPAEDGTPAAKEARAKALEGVHERVTLATLVAIVAEPTSDAPRAADRVLALLLVRAEPAEKVRPLLLRAVTAADFKQGPRKDLLDALASFPADDAGTQTTTLFSKIDDLRKEGVKLEDFSGAMAETRAHDKLPLLYDWLLSPTTKPESVPGMAKVCQAVQSTLTEPDVPLLELMKKVDGVKDLLRLQYAFIVLRDSDGRIAGPLSRRIREIERDGDQRVVPPELKASLNEAYVTLARLPSPNVPPAWASAAEGYGYLVTTLKMLRSSDLRACVLGAIGQIRRSESFPTKGFLDRLVAVMTDGGLTDKEQESVGSALTHLTGQKFGTNATAWRAYVDKLER